MKYTLLTCLLLLSGCLETQNFHPIRDGRPKKADTAPVASVTSTTMPKKSEPGIVPYHGNPTPPPAPSTPQPEEDEMTEPM